MNGAEFFMKYAGYRLLPKDLHGDDPVVDTEKLFGIALPIYTGKTLRLSSGWMVVTPSWVSTSFKAMPEMGFEVGGERQPTIAKALKTGEPCLILSMGKRTMAARDLFITYDPRATRYCSEASVRTTDSTKEKWWTF